MSVRPLTQDDLRWLVCPVCYQELRLVLSPNSALNSSAESSPETSPDSIQCTACAREYSLVDGLPVLLTRPSNT